MAANTMLAAILLQYTNTIQYNVLYCIEESLLNLKGTYLVYRACRGFTHHHPPFFPDKPCKPSGGNILKVRVIIYVEKRSPAITGLPRSRLRRWLNILTIK